MLPLTFTVSSPISNGVDRKRSTSASGLCLRNWQRSAFVTRRLQVRSLPPAPRFAFGYAWRSHAAPKAKRARRSPQGEAGPVAASYGSASLPPEAD